MKRSIKTSLICILTLITVQGSAEIALASDNAPGSTMTLIQATSETPPLPHWREGGTPYDASQSLYPHSISQPISKDQPLSGYIAAPPEYDPSRGVLFWFHSGHWHEVVVDLVASLTGDAGHDEIAYVVVTSTSQRSYATNLFEAAGADMSKVAFFIEPGNAVWIRDYGPHFIWQDSTLGIVNSQYYSTRSLDAFVPVLLGEDHFFMPVYNMGLSYAGGNFQPGPNRSGFVTSLVNLENNPSGGFDEDFIAELYKTYQGIDTLHIMPQLPTSVDLTGHIDMWMYLVDENTVIISEFLPGSNADAITITNNAVTYMEGLGFEVYRTPAWNANHPSAGYNTNWTYTNALRVNDRIFVSRYGTSWPPYLDEDAEAMAAWEAATGPEIEIVPIDCFDIIWAAGAIHCIAMQVPRYINEAPSVCLISPDGGELLTANATHTIAWAATDTDNEMIPTVDLYYSTDDGSNWDFIASTTDTGFYEWTVPYVSTEFARVKVVATSHDSDQGEDISAGAFQIAEADQIFYDFTTGAGTDKFGRGYHTSNWASGIDGDRTPVTSNIEALQSGAYDRISFSDATGGDSDANRYSSPNPSTDYESTHIFEFTIDEDPSEIDDVAITWEGYSDNCAQIELYLWDCVEGQWGDGSGNFGQNRFADSYAGNRDGFLTWNIRSDFDRYIDGTGQMTLLVYSERGPDGYYITYSPSFHDHIAVTVTEIAPPYLCGDADGSDAIDIDDVVYLIAYIFSGGEAPEPYEAGDADCSGGVDIDDVVFLINFIFSGGPQPCDTDDDGEPDC